jgi:hypothetical protein
VRSVHQALVQVKLKFTHKKTGKEINLPIRKKPEPLPSPDMHSLLGYARRGVKNVRFFEIIYNMEPVTGIEPVVFPLPWGCFTTEPHRLICLSAVRIRNCFLSAGRLLREPNQINWIPERFLTMYKTILVKGCDPKPMGKTK